MAEGNSMTYEEAIAALSAYRDETGKSQRAIAKELGISDGLVSAFLSGSYKTPHTIIPKVENLTRVKEKRRVAPEEPGFAETTVAKAVMEAISYCHLQGKVAVVYGDAGTGKTMAVREYLRGNSLAIGFTASPAYASITGINDLLVKHLGAKERVARKIYAEAVEKLRGSGRVLVVDEAQHLTVRTLDYLRCISDESGVGLALVGNYEVYTKMKGSGEAAFAQLFSRIGMRRQVLTGSICRKDVELVFREAFLDGESVDLLLRIARTKYGLRGAVNVCVNTAAVFGGVTAPELARMAQEMNIG